MIRVCFGLRTSYNGPEDAAGEVGGDWNADRNFISLKTRDDGPGRTIAGTENFRQHQPELLDALHIRGEVGISRSHCRKASQGAEVNRDTIFLKLVSHLKAIRPRSTGHRGHPGASLVRASRRPLYTRPSNAQPMLAITCSLRHASHKSRKYMICALSRGVRLKSQLLTARILAYTPPDDSRGSSIRLVRLISVRQPHYIPRSPTTMGPVMTP